jgi:hypothetical protein
MRAELLNSLLQKHIDGKLIWIPREGEKSFETRIGDFSFHIDRKPGPTKIVYRIWTFDAQGEALDNFDTALLDEDTPEDVKFPNFTAVAKFIFNDVKDNITLGALSPAVSKLKEI